MRAHFLVRAQWNLHVDKGKAAVLRGNEVFAPHDEQQVQDLLIEHFPSANLLFHHVKARAFDVD
jgi:hypothetical protein